MKRSEPMRIGEVITQMIEATGLRPELNRRSIESAWPTVVGKHIAAYTASVRVVERTLYVDVRSASLKEELMYLRELLVKQLNEHVGASVIDRISLR
ncbi:MAG: DUF721 domain-containing protein [Bacteroidales bacterium]|nr:DUF721 domain-containing protein [Bacteroidales bacterium]MDE6436326.1 DUF721 domain-containing protein [Muribaculaceae bacterium]